MANGGIICNYQYWSRRIVKHRSDLVCEHWESHGNIISTRQSKIKSNAPLKTNIDKFIIIDESEGRDKSSKSTVISHQLKYSSGINGILEFKKATVRVKANLLLLAGPISPHLWAKESVYCGKDSVLMRV